MLYETNEFEEVLKKIHSYKDFLRKNEFATKDRKLYRGNFTRYSILLSQIIHCINLQWAKQPYTDCTCGFRKFSPHIRRQNHHHNLCTAVLLGLLLQLHDTPQPRLQKTWGLRSKMKREAAFGDAVVFRQDAKWQSSSLTVCSSIRINLEPHQCMCDLAERL